MAWLSRDQAIFLAWGREQTRGWGWLAEKALSFKSGVRYNLYVDWAQVPDEVLLLEIARGNKETISVLYDRYARLVFSLALTILRDRMLAEEVTQDTFLNAWRGAAGFQPELGRVSTWLLAIARHRAIDELRRRHRAMLLNLEDVWGEALVTNSPTTGGEEWLLRMQMKKALDELPQEQKQAIYLAYFRGLTQEEIAKVLGEPLGTIKTRIRLGMKKLREAMHKP